MLTKINIKDLNTSIVQEFDLFICFNSFEKRCYSIAKHIPENMFRFKLILTNSTPLENEEQHLIILKDTLANQTEVVEINIANPIDFADKIISSLHKVERENSLRRIFIDITTFTHETLLILLAILADQYQGSEIICAYNNAKEYSTDHSDLNSKWLSRGSGDVRTILGYSGDYKPSQENLLLLIAGYEYERASKIIDSISPDYLYIGYNVEDNATTEKDKNANTGYVKLLKNLSAYYDHTFEFNVPCDDPFEAYKAICTILDSINQKVNVIIVPMNNKISTIGVALTALSRPEIQVCYAPAIVYNAASYSTPGDLCYIFSFNSTEIMTKENEQ